MKKCLEKCIELSVTCPAQDCRYWMDHPSDNNCVLDTVNKYGDLTLRETSERLGISYVRVKQIEDKALKKISHLLK